MNECREITKCEVCGSHDLAQVLDLGEHPLCDDLVPVGDPQNCQVFPIKIVYCKVCETAHQQFQVPKVRLDRKSVV